jgi:uncharacterized protein (TIGR02466 family)
MALIIRPPKLLFPSKIQVSFDSNFNEYKDGMIEWMHGYAKNNKTNHRSNHGGYQSPDQFFREETFGQYLNRISDHIFASLEEYGSGIRLFDHNLYLSNMWFNFNRRDNYNITHTHPGCIVSGVLYVKTPENCGEIVFIDPMAHNSSEIDENISEIYTPVEGEMILFPAHLPHRVEPNYSDELRISVSFNICVS